MPSLEKAENEEDATYQAIVRAMNGLTIIERLEFVKNVIFDRGGSKDHEGRDPVLVTAADVLRGVIGVLKKYPEAAGLRYEP